MRAGFGAVLPLTLLGEGRKRGSQPFDLVVRIELHKFPCDIKSRESASRSLATSPPRVPKMATSTPCVPRRRPMDGGSRAEVVAGAGEVLAAWPIAARWCRPDFFHSVVPGGDAYVLAQILHDWPDEKCVEILRKCAGPHLPSIRHPAA
jgi:hypothetical protein